MTHAETIATIDEAIKAIADAQAAIQRLLEQQEALLEHVEAKPEPHELANFLAFSHEGDEHGNNLGVGAV